MASPSSKRIIIKDGPHTKEVLNVLAAEIDSPEARAAIVERAAEVIARAVDPISGPPEIASDGLLYGLIQSGKTSVITVAAAMAADNGFDCIVILTSDIDLLYDQTLDRIKKALRGLSVLGKNDWKDADRFQRQLRNKPLAIVCSKNGSRLQSLLDAFKEAKAKGLSVLLIDDEADQASLDTNTSKRKTKPTIQLSKINEVITDFRGFFPVNTYLQVTATPQSLFLQRPDGRYRPSFSVLSSPGPGYVGGEVFFGPEAPVQILRKVDLNEVSSLQASHQPAPTGDLPPGLRKAVITFLVSATVKVIERPSEGFALLVHVSMNKADHAHIVKLIDRFKQVAVATFTGGKTAAKAKFLKEVQEAYDDLALTQADLPAFDTVVEKMKFYINGTNIKLINASSGEEIKLDSVYNVFVGGNKLGRGVTIKNLLVSYYGRNPKKPNADTVLQHARMYGYRSGDVGVTRLFLPDKLTEHFRLIHQMEGALRELVENHPDGKFEGIYVSDPLQATRKNVLDPNSIGLYVAGKGYNPRYPLRTPDAKKNTDWIDDRLKEFKDATCYEVPIDLVTELIDRCVADPTKGVELWKAKTLKASLEALAKVRDDKKAYVVIKRGLSATTPRREDQGVISGKGEADLALRDKPTLFLHRENANGQEVEAWWPQLHFPDGNYALAFSFDW